MSFVSHRARYRLAQSGNISITILKLFATLNEMSEKIVSYCWHRSTRSHHFDLSVISGNKIFGEQFFFYTLIFSLALAIIVHWAVTKNSRIRFAPSFSLSLSLWVSACFCFFFFVNFQFTIDGRQNQIS